MWMCGKLLWCRSPKSISVARQIKIEQPWKIWNSGLQNLFKTYSNIIQHVLLSFENTQNWSGGCLQQISGVKARYLSLPLETSFSTLALIPPWDGDVKALGTSKSQKCHALPILALWNFTFLSGSERKKYEKHKQAASHIKPQNNK